VACERVKPTYIPLTVMYVVYSVVAVYAYEYCYSLVFLLFYIEFQFLRSHLRWITFLLCRLKELVRSVILEIKLPTFIENNPMYHNSDVIYHQKYTYYMFRPNWTTVILISIFWYSVLRDDDPFRSIQIVTRFIKCI
jgi:hypothetical protein